MNFYDKLYLLAVDTKIEDALKEAKKSKPYSSEEPEHMSAAARASLVGGDILSGARPSQAGVRPSYKGPDVYPPGHPKAGQRMPASVAATGWRTRLRGSGLKPEGKRGR